MRLVGVLAIVCAACVPMPPRNAVDTMFPTIRRPVDERVVGTMAIVIAGGGLVATGVAMADCADGGLGCHVDHSGAPLGGGMAGLLGMSGYGVAALGIVTLMMAPVFALTSGGK